MGLYEYKLSENVSVTYHNNGEKTANFTFPYNNMGELEAENMYEVCHWMKEKWGDLSNGEWYWESDEDFLEGWISFENHEDGLAVYFDVKKIS